MDPQRSQGRGPGGDAERPPPPAEFQAGLDALATVRARREVELEHIPAPQRLAPWSHAIGARVAEPSAEAPGEDDLEIASGRFIVLYDPAGHEAWDGTTRCVGYVSAVTDETMVDDEMFSSVAWSWLVEALVDHGADHHSLGGTVTRTASTRFGDIAGPEHSVDVEIRASWTATGTELDRHLGAWLEVLGNAAGLPPPGVHLLGQGRAPGSSTS